MLEVELAWCGAGGPCSEQAGKLQTYLDYMFMKSNFSLNIFMSGSVMTESAVDHETDTFAHSRDQTSHLLLSPHPSCRVMMNLIFIEMMMYRHTDQKYQLVHL